jgi:lantibiotic transport system permease protein
VVRIPFWRSVWSEWLKRRRSLAVWLVVGGGLLVPVMTLLLRLRQRRSLPALYQGEVFWEQLWNQVWESLATILLPVGVIVLTSLVTQHEQRHNAWKQVHASPQPLANVFAAKLLIVLFMVAQAFAVLLVGIWCVGAVPALLFAEVSMPVEPFPLLAFLARGANFFLDVLPIVAVQFMLGLLSRNILVPIGVGLGMWIVSLTALTWQYNYLVPYSYAAIDFMSETGSRVSRAMPLPLSYLGPLVAACICVFAVTVYARRGDHG